MKSNIVDLIKNYANPLSINLDLSDVDKSSEDILKQASLTVDYAVGSIKRGSQATLENLVVSILLKENKSIADVVNYFNDFELNALIKHNTQTTTSKVEIIEAGDDELSLWRYLKYAQVAPDTQDFVVRSSATSEEYRYLHSDKNEIAANYISFLQRTGLFDTLKDEYQTLVNMNYEFLCDSELKNITKVGKDKTIIKYASFQKYINKTLREIRSYPELCLYKPISTLSTSPDIPCYKYFDLNNLKEGKFTAWQEFLNKFDSPKHAELFMEWIWTIFEDKNTSSQALIFRGAANDGKSVVSEIIAELMGDNGYGALADGDLNSEFWASNIWNKRLVIWGDTKMNHPLSKGKIHNLASNENIQVNIKNRNQFSIKFQGKLWLNTNEPIFIKNETNEIRRTLYLKLNRPSTDKLKEFCQVDDNGNLVKGRNGEYIYIGDSNWKQRLRDEKYHFLYACREIYKKNNKGGNVELPIDIYDDMLDTITEESDFDYIISDFYIDIDKGNNTTVGSLKDWFNGKTSKAQMARSEFYKFNKFTEFLSSKGYQKKRITVSGKKLTVIDGISLTDPDNSNSYNHYNRPDVSTNNDWE